MVDVFIPTLSQLAYLFILIFVGFLIIKIKILPESSDTILSKLESYVLIPSLILSTFMTNFKIENISSYGVYFLAGILVSLLMILVAIIFTKILYKGDKLYSYGIAFSNFSFMGNAVVLALFPSIFTEYLIFVLPFWFFVYLWGVPSLLRINSNEKITFKDRIKVLINPMVFSMFIGIFIGLINLKLPVFLTESVITLGSLMTPIAMLITGMTIAKIDIGKMIRKFSVYTLSIIRLVVIPLLAIFILYFVEFSYSLKLCIICSLAMPLGLNSIIILNAYGHDTQEASAMALISHLLSLITIPFIFTILNFMLK